MPLKGAFMVHYLIWGTGKAAKNFIIPHLDCYFLHNPIVAFIDSNKEKEGKYLFGKKIFSPEMIANLNFDYVIIGSTFVEEIIRQLDRLGINKDCIKTMPEATFDIIDYFMDECQILQKKILVIGNPVRYKQMEHEFNARIHVVDVIDGKQLDQIKRNTWDYILFMDTGNLSEDFTVTEKEIRKELKITYGIEETKFLSYSVFQLFLDTDFPISYGNDFPEKTFLLIHQTATAGLGALVLTVALNTAFAKTKGWIPVVDFSTYPNNYLEEDEIGKDNAWEKFFEQPDNYSVNDIQSAKNVIWSAIGRPGMNASDLSFLKVKPKLKRKIDDYCKILFASSKKMLGVLFRGTDYVNRKPFRHFIQPSLQQMLEVVKEKKEEWQMENIYLCTEVEEAVKLFQLEFGSHLHYYPQHRYPIDCKDYLANTKTTGHISAYQKGCDYWILLNALSKCDSLVAGNCGGTQIAQLLNQNNYQNVYIFNLGRYGIDDLE